jgi:uncharacterized protein (DUF433 family)
MNWHDYITANAAILVGKPVIRGTRLAVEFILDLLAQGWTEAEIARNYHLTAEQIRAGIACARERLNEERVFAVAAGPAMRLCANENIPTGLGWPLQRRGRFHDPHAPTAGPMSRLPRTQGTFVGPDDTAHALRKERSVRNPWTLEG